MIVVMHIIYILFEDVSDIISPNNLVLNSFFDTLLKIKVLYWHQWLHEEPLTSIEFSIAHKVL